ncbi:hypothetical protein FRB90_010756, partial [Tulasnella sp. 427]
MEEYGEGYSFGFQSGRWQPPAYLIKDQLAETERRKDARAARQAERDAAAFHHRGREDTPAPRRQNRPTFATSPDRERATAAGVPMIMPSREAPPSPTKRGASRPRPGSIMLGPRPPLSHQPTSTSSAAANEERDRRRMPPPPSPTRRPTGLSRTGSEQQHQQPPAPSSSQPPAPPSNTTTAARAIESTTEEIVRARFGFGSAERADIFAAATAAAIASRNAAAAAAQSSSPSSAAAAAGGSATSPVFPPGLEKTSSKGGGRDGPPKVPFPSTSPQGLGLNFPASGGDPSTQLPSSRTRTSALPPSTPAPTPTIQPPTVDNPDLQKFFIEVAGVINHLSSPGSSAPNTPGPTTGAGGSLFAQQSAAVYGGAGMRATGSEGSAPKRMPQQQGSQPLGRRLSSKEDEDADDGYVHVSAAKSSSAVLGGGGSKKHRPTPLELSGNARSSVFGPGPAQSSPIPSPLLTGSDFPKGQGWFTSLFNFKPASYNL